MSGQIKLFSESLIAGEDLSSKQYRFVKLSASRTVVACGNGERPYGILQNNPESGEMAEVMTVGVSNLVAAGDIDAGEAVGSNAAGEGLEATDDRAFYGAIAREDAVDNDIFSVFVIGGGAARSNA